MNGRIFRPAPSQPLEYSALSHIQREQIWKMKFRVLNGLFCFQAEFGGGGGGEREGGKEHTDMSPTPRHDLSPPHTTLIFHSAARGWFCCFKPAAKSEIVSILKKNLKESTHKATVKCNWEQNTLLQSLLAPLPTLKSMGIPREKQPAAGKGAESTHIFFLGNNLGKPLTFI